MPRCDLAHAVLCGRGGVARPGAFTGGGVSIPTMHRQANWSEAQHTCTGKGAALPVIQTPRHNQDLQGRVRTSGPRAWTQRPSSAVWLGLVDQHPDSVLPGTNSGEWVWVDGNR